MKKQIKRVDIITKYFHPVNAGIETNIYQIYRNFVKNGWRVTVHTSQDTFTQKNILTKKDQLEGIEIKRYKYSTFGFNPRIEWNETDLVSLHNFNLFPHSFILLRILYLKIINRKKFHFTLTLHGGFNPEWRVFSFGSRVIKYLYNNTLGLFLINNSVDSLRAISNWEKRELIKSGIQTKKILLVPNGLEDIAVINPESKVSREFKNRVSNYKPYIIQLGRIYAIKNYETVIKALPLIDTNISFIIAGPVEDLEYKKKLQILIKKLKLKNRVHFIGEVRRFDKYYLLKNAEMMVHMSLWESFCNAVNEGMSQGLVCLVSDNTALKSLVKNNRNGFRISTFDYKELAKKINFTYQNKQDLKIEEIKKYNREYAKKMTWKNASLILQKHFAEEL